MLVNVPPTTASGPLSHTFLHELKPLVTPLAFVILTRPFRERMIISRKRKKSSGMGDVHLVPQPPVDRTSHSVGFRAMVLNLFSDTSLGQYFVYHVALDCTHDHIN